MTPEFLNDLLAEVERCESDTDLFGLILRAWSGYREQGASHFDWDYDSRPLMAALLERHEDLDGRG